jgi:hypothetical protein
VFSPARFDRRACAGGIGRYRAIRARGPLAGVLGLATSLALLSSTAARAQFPIRQVPSRWNTPVVSPTGREGRPLGPSGPAAAGNQIGPQPRPAPHPAIARITVPERDGVSHGSGTLIDVRGQFGLVITNWHVIRDAAGPITVEFPEGHKTQAEVVRTDKDWDLAALSILRPKAEPLPVTPYPPQPGEPLTIAGYGGGDYRVAAGPCTQYLAPGSDLPYEMVELAAEARQGDSGGPILNQRGEVCGVLFGSGPGYTSGSYGGRVRQFLATVIPGGEPGSDIPGASLAASQPPAIASPPANQLPATVAAPAGPAARIDSPTPPYVARSVEKDAAMPLTPAEPRPTMLAPPADMDARSAVDNQLATNMPDSEQTAGAAPLGAPARIQSSLPPRASAAAIDLNQAPPDQVAAAIWKRLGGVTLFDQTKSVLAIIGVLAVMVQFWRFSSRPDRDADDE